MAHLAEIQTLVGTAVEELGACTSSIDTEENMLYNS
jgi:hypothetical protein